MNILLKWGHIKKGLNYFSLLLLVAIAACSLTRQVHNKETHVDLVPYPRSLGLKKGEQTLSKLLAIKADEELVPYAEVFAGNLKSLTGIALPVQNEGSSKHSIVLKLNPELESREYRLETGKSVMIEAGSEKSLVNGAYTFLQSINETEGQFYFPGMIISDSPDSEYRGLLIDLARNWHDVPTILKLIDLAAWYKINYLHLHFTDYQSYTLPSKHFPKLPSKNRHYSFEELETMEEYAALRGVTIIPEIDIPGHSQAIINAYPELFGIKHIKRNPYCINMGKEEVYEALEKIIAEAISVFDQSPYFHIGGDEAIFNWLKRDPHVKSYMAKHGLGDDIHELYRHFIVRMNNIVKKHGKQMCVWEGFRREGTVEIPKDIIVFEFETNRYLPNHLLEDGYTVVNTSWKPLYVVNEKKWSPEYIYGWNIWRWENWFDKAPSYVPIQCEKSDLVIGGQMCAWEQKQELEFPSLRKRLAAFSERVWTTGTSTSPENFMSRLKQTDALLSTLVNDTRQDTLTAFKN